MCACRNVCMYYTSGSTLVLFVVIWITALVMFFVATLWPVMVWVATTPFGLKKLCPHNDAANLLTFHFAKSALRNILYDSIFPQLRGGKDGLWLIVSHGLC